MSGRQRKAALSAGVAAAARLARRTGGVPASPTQPFVESEDSPMSGRSDRRTGRIRYYNSARGEGIVRCLEDDRDVKFTRSDIPQDYRVDDAFFKLDGLRVSFVSSDFGERAREIKALRELDDTLLGVVRSYNPGKGYGFISSSAMKSDAFFGRADVPSELAHVDLLNVSVKFKASVQDESPADRDGSGRRNNKALGVVFNLGHPQQQQQQQQQQQRRHPSMFPTGGGHVMAPAAVAGLGSMQQGPFVGPGFMHQLGGRGMPLGFPLGKAPGAPGMLAGQWPGMVNMPPAPVNGRLLAPGSLGIGNKLLGDVVNNPIFAAAAQAAMSGMPAAAAIATAAASLPRRHMAMPSMPMQLPPGIANTPVHNKNGPDDVVMGALKSYHPDKGFGVISAPGLPRDVFFANTSLAAPIPPSGLVAGQPVSFRLSQRPDGTLHANEVVVRFREGQEVTGKIRSFADGVGRVSVEGRNEDVAFTTQDLSANLFGMKTTHKDRHGQVTRFSYERLLGQAVRFTLHFNAEGHPQAQNLTLIANPIRKAPAANPAKAPQVKVRPVLSRRSGEPIATPVTPGLQNPSAPQVLGTVGKAPGTARKARITVGKAKGTVVGRVPHQPGVLRPKAKLIPPVPGQVRISSASRWLRHSSSGANGVVSKHGGQQLEGGVDSPALGLGRKRKAAAVEGKASGAPSSTTARRRKRSRRARGSPGNTGSAPSVPPAQAPPGRPPKPSVAPSIAGGGAYLQ
eukprot:TRINITY_DN17678_c0_g1_i1.p1 TRINITY_DN17678_c0_g1~~TRINITY_DN17678_c0_g1_i1.p1  ORF type:complete len:738 (+),score=118.32 TRINITY_DN17678_c0_g1_i1:79-2292(+)